MKILTYSIFRALCAIAVGALLVKFREQMVEWMTIAIGVLFLISGAIAMIASMSKKKVNPNHNNNENDSEVVPVNVDVEKETSNRAGWGWGSFVGMGCMILGLILALMPRTFVDFLVYIISAFLIIGAIQQFATLAVARRNGSVGFFYWVMPTILFILGCIALFKPTVFASAPLFFIGWFLIIYGIVECINALKARSNRKQAEKFYNINQKPDFSDAEVVEAEELP
jgi:uncharacterized membrane protein HdeD (DUF308 family)